MHAHDCGVDRCGCVRYEPVDLVAREARKRLWTGQVSFLVRSGWTKPCEVRVRAMGHAGAAAAAVREGKRHSLARGTRVMQVRLSLVSVPRSAGR
jgi:hypothetical protein